MAAKLPECRREDKNVRALAGSKSGAREPPVDSSAPSMQSVRRNEDGIEKAEGA